MSTVPCEPRQSYQFGAKIDDVVFDAVLLVAVLCLEAVSHCDTTTWPLAWSHVPPYCLPFTILLLLLHTMADLYNLFEADEQVQATEEVSQEWEQPDISHPPSLDQALAFVGSNEKGTTTSKDRLDLADITSAVSDHRSKNTPYDKLKRMWAQELCSPELLQYDAETIDTLLADLRLQEERMDVWEGTGNKNTDALMVRLLNIDAERVRYLLCNLFKQRLHKIEAYPLHNMRENVKRMSTNEVSSYLCASLFRYFALTETKYCCSP
jgi:hypothetical protein